jgi:hypothetical protein
MRNHLGQTAPLLRTTALLRNTPLKSLLSDPSTSRGYDVGVSETTSEEEARRRQQFETAGAAIDAALREAAAQEEAAAAAAAAEAAKPFYVRKYGSLPFWAWAVGGTALLGVGVVVIRRRRK